MQFLEVILCITLSLNSVCSLFFTPTIEIDQGKLRGMRALSGMNQYLGIPYATSERFEPPKKPKRWEGVFNAINGFSACAQYRNMLLITNEDCLQLDIYTPENSKRGDKLPVMVFIHGGSFFSGAKGLYNPEFLVTKNIITVTINYRLGVLGFLCVNGVANLGLKDQVAALKWVKKNIAAFGGDPNQVTLAGQSAGAAATSMHLLSEQSRGLFHKAILMSGYALASWTYNLEQFSAALTDANKISEAETEEEIYRTFSTAPIRVLLTATRDVNTNLRYFKYAPCVDSNLTEPFFRDTPYEIITSGRFNKVPVLMGVTDQEGISFFGANNDSTFADFNTNFAEYLPSVFSCSEEDRDQIARRIRNHYFEKRSINEKAVKSVVKYASDWLDHATFDAFSELLVRHGGEPVYKYVFSYDGGMNFIKTMLGGAASTLKGASHSDDLFYVFKPASASISLSKQDKQMIDRYTTMLTNFIKKSDPTPSRTSLLPVDWPSSTKRESFIMHLDRTLEVTKGPYQKDSFFFDQLCTYGFPGYVPCESQQACLRDTSDKNEPIDMQYPADHNVGFNFFDLFL